MDKWEWGGQWFMDRVGWHAESGDTGSKTTIQIHVFIYVKEQALSILCNSFEMQDSDGDFEMGIKCCYPTEELLTPKT